MFGKKKRSKEELIVQVLELSEKASDEFLDYIKRDNEVYDLCINDTPIKNTTIIYMMSLYFDMLASKYNLEDVFSVISTAIYSGSPTEEMGEKNLNAMMDFSNQLREITKYFKQFPNYDFIRCLTTFYFSLLMYDEKPYDEIDNKFKGKVCYRKIYDHFKGICNNSVLLQEKYDMREK